MRAKSAFYERNAFHFRNILAHQLLLASWTTTAWGSSLLDPHSSAFQVFTHKAEINLALEAWGYHSQVQSNNTIHNAF